MIILGIDPGSRRTGFGLIETDGHRHRYITSGCVRTEQAEFVARLPEIFSGISRIVSEFQPNQAAIERVFLHQNADSALKLGQARGAAIVALTPLIDLAEYSPRQIKQAVVGYGAAEKTQVQEMVKHLLHISGDLQEDAADALGVALCHVHSLNTIWSVA